MSGKNRGFYRMLSFLLCAVLLCRAHLWAGESPQSSGSSPVQDFAAEPDAGSAPLLEEKEFPDLPLVLPRRYDAREKGYDLAVKSQGSYGTCWALAATSAIEASLPLDMRTQFSADHMALHNHFAASLSDGGDYIMVMAYLSGWQGPVTEKEDPYGDAYSPEGLFPAVHVQEIRLLENCPAEEIKEAVYRYGAVQTSLYMKRSETLPEKGYYDPVNAAWYYPQKKTQNHDVIILGWDDDYSRFHFSQIPPADGAFICQNSWGEAFGEDGIFYVSYADANIARMGLVYSRIDTADNYDLLYQTDDCGWVGQQGYASETCWFANVYTAGETNGTGSLRGAAGGSGETETLASAAVQGADAGTPAAGNGSENTSRTPDAGSGSENTSRASDAGNLAERTPKPQQEQDPHIRLDAFGFYATGPDTVYELYLVHDFENPDSFSNMEFLQSGILEQSGYYTADLDEPVMLRTGERFAMVVKITTPDEAHPAAVEYQADTYSQGITTEGKEGYLSQDGNYWENTEQKFGSNVCLKGYLSCL